MKNKSSVRTRGLWSSFYHQEQDLLAWVNKHTTVLHSLEEAALVKYSAKKGVEDETLTKAPKHIRHVTYLNENDSRAELLKLIELTKGKYKKAFLEQAELNGKLISKINYPSRFPQYKEGVYQVNLSNNSAYSSVGKSKLNVQSGDRLDVKSGYIIDDNEVQLSDIEIALNALHKFGLKSAKMEFEAVSADTKSYKLSVDMLELFELTKANHLQFRVFTGRQFRARLFNKSDAIKPERVRFGFIILDSKAVVEKVLPQPARPHSLEKTGVKFELPINSNLDIFIKE